MRPHLIPLLLSLCACSSPSPRSDIDASASTHVAWTSWSEAAFTRARAEGKLVLLDLQAVWCHWCHVMERETYGDPHVARFLAEHFVAIQVDQDARPDVSIRFEDYGWPATVVFDAEGRELVKRAGFVPPERMLAMLEAVVADPTPGPSVLAEGPIAFATAGALAPELERELEIDVVARFDPLLGGYGRVHKFVDPLSVEWLLVRAREGDAEAAGMARRTLDAGLQLIDPVWGGVYQYSAGGVWTEPHFEKIMSFQAEEMRVYALASAVLGEPRYADAARAIEGYLAGFLTSPAGAFYTSQDADLVPGEHAEGYFALDDAGRRARGVPRIDVNSYARENGWAIRGLCALASWTGDEDALERARRAAMWVIRERAREGGGFAHGERDAAGPYLGDTLAMGQAFLALYETTGERDWLTRAGDAVRFVARNFGPEAGRAGFKSAAGRGGATDKAVYQRDENIALARLANALVHYAGPEFAPVCDEALRFLATRAIALGGLPGGVLLAARESRADPLHVTVVGAKEDPGARALFAAANRIADPYRRIEWYDASEGPLPNEDVPFPDALPRAAAFVCTQGRCSTPAFDPADVARRVRSSLPVARPIAGS